MKPRAASEPDAAGMRSSTHWAVLGLIIERPSHGYDLAERFERVYGDVLNLSSPSYIYTSVKELIRRGLIEELPGKRVGRQPKPPYRATAEGVRAYQQQLIAEIDEDRRRSRLFARKLAVFAREPQLALEVIGRYRRACLEVATKTALPRGDRDASMDLAAGLAGRLEAEEIRLALDTKIDWLDYAARELTALIESQTPRT
jgi:DNA-binding PadR family transcriptional regulator